MLVTDSSVILGAAIELEQKNCPSCKKPVEGINQFCPYCGIKLTAIEEQEKEPALETPTASTEREFVSCLLCGKKIPATNDYCSYCGTQRYKIREEKNNAKKTIPCSKCNSQNPPDNKYCHHCGNPIGLVGIEKLFKGRKFSGFEIPLTALAVPMISSSDAAILTKVLEKQGRESSFPYRVESLGTSLYSIEAKSYKSFRSSITNVLLPYNLPNFIVTCFLVSVVYALWMTVLTSIKNESPLLLGELVTLVTSALSGDQSDTTNSCLTFDRTWDNYVRSLPYSLLVATVLIAPSLILAILVFRQDESLIEYRVSPITVGISFGFSMLVSSVIQPGYPVATEQVPARDLGYAYAIGLFVTEGVTFILFLIVLGETTDVYDLGLPKEVSSHLSLAFVFAAWACLFFTFPIANPLWKSVFQFNKVIYYIFLAMTICFILSNFLYFEDIHTLIYETYN